jgi:ribosomal protein S12 methylthiotransferase accessory factor
VSRGLTALASPFVGIVGEVHEFMIGPDDARLASFACTVADGSETIGAATRFDCGSVHFDRDRARSAALGEACERYCLAAGRHEGLRVGSARGLGSRAIAAPEVELFTATQYNAAEFPYLPFDEDVPVAWVDGTSCLDGEPIAIPSQIVHLSDRLLAGEAPISYSTSNGAACASDPARAALRGLLEVVERDAFMLTWYHRLSWPKIDVSSSARLSELERRHFKPAGIEYYVMDASDVHGVPCAIAVLRADDTSGAALAVGAAAGLSLGEAWEKALREAFQTRAWATGLRRTYPDRKFAVFSEVRELADHVLFYTSDAHAVLADFLISESAAHRVSTDELPDGRDGLARVVSALSGQGFAPALVDVTSPDVRILGLHVVKAVCPGLLALDVAYDERLLGAARLGDIRSINHDPHPFP